jgi:hypothetical protein
MPTGAEEPMKKLCGVAAFFIFFLPSLRAVEHRFLSREQQEKYIKSREALPKSTACPNGEDIPIKTTYAPDGRVLGEPQLWKNNKKGWLRRPGLTRLIEQAVNFVKKSRLLLPGLTSKTQVIVRVPCGQ